MDVCLQVSLLLLLFYLLACAADQFFTPTLEVIGAALKMSPDVAGLTILALGNGAPDLSTAISSLVLAKPIDIVTGGLFGAAMFVSSIVVASVAFIGKHVKLDAPSFVRDLAFYLVGTVGVYFITWDGKVYLYEAILFLLYYFGYVAFALITHYCSCCKGKKKERNQMGGGVGNDEDDIPSTVDDYGTMGSGRLNKHSINAVIGDNGPSVERLRGNSSGSEDSDENASLIRRDGGAVVNGGDEENVFASHLKHAGHKHGDHAHGECPEGGDGHDSDDDDDDDTPFTFERWFAWWRTKSIIKRVWILVSSILLLPMHVSVPSIKWNRYTYATGIPATVALIYLAMGYYPIFLAKRIWISWTVCFAISSIMGLIIFFTSSWDEPPRYKPAFVVLSFFSSIVWISMVADQLVSVLQSMGVILGIPAFVLGATVLAWGNSVGDLVADIVMAQKGFPGSALSAAYAGPMMNMLIGMGVGLTVRCATIFPTAVEVAASKSFLMSGGFLFFILYGSLVVLWIRKWVLDWWWGIVLVVVYLLFNLFTGLVEGGVIWKH